MTTGRKWSRRTFVGSGLVSVGAVAGALIRRACDPARKGLASPKPATAAYDVSEFERTDPKHLLYQPAGSFETGFDRVKRLVTGPGGLVLVAGDRSIKLLDTSGMLHKEIQLDRPPHCLKLIGQDELLVGLADCFEIYDLAGKRKMHSPRFRGGTFLTAIDAHQGTIYFADAGNREVVMCSRSTGEITGRFGKREEPPGAPGFVVPSPYFDLAVGRDGLHVVNPGRLRVERYSFDGRFESSWGQPGMAIDRFCGCCNPVYLALTPDGFLTSEKGLARVKIYNATGSFVGAVAGPETLVQDRELAKRTCADRRLGGGFDIARDETGRVFVLDPFEMTVRVFTPRGHT